MKHGKAFGKPHGTKHGGIPQRGHASKASHGNVIGKLHPRGLEKGVKQARKPIRNFKRPAAPVGKHLHAKGF
jgi:hypothetical protein